MIWSRWVLRGRIEKVIWGGIASLMLSQGSQAAPAIQLFGELGTGSTSQTVAYDEARLGFSVHLGVNIGADWESGLSIQSYRQSLGSSVTASDLLLSIRTRYRAPFLNKVGFIGGKIGRLIQSQTFTYDSSLGYIGGELADPEDTTVKNKIALSDFFVAPEIGIDHRFNFLPKVTFSVSAEMPIYLRNGVSAMFNTYFGVRYTL